MLTEAQGKFLLRLARKTIEEFVSNRKTSKPEKYDAIFDEKRGVFCTLEEKYGSRYELRGCIGLPYPSTKLIDAVIEAAKSSTRDPRFEPLTKSELSKIRIELSILTQPELLTRGKKILDKLKPHEDGLILQCRGASALFLPQVWEELPDKEIFLQNLCLKAGLPPDEWMNDSCIFYVFHVQAFKEGEA